MVKPAKHNFSVVSMLALHCKFSAQSPDLMVMVHQSTGGDCCTTGCVFFDRGKCPSYQKLKTAETGSKAALESVLHHTGMLTLVMGMSANYGIQPPYIVAGLSNLLAANPLVPTAEELWVGAKTKFPSEDGGIDTDALAAKIKEIYKLRG
jgi:hypothetical protein